MWHSAVWKTARVERRIRERQVAPVSQLETYVPKVGGERPRPLEEER
jgi:hypothetical protein